MKWLEKQQADENMEDYMSYLITKSLEGKMTPTKEGVIRILKGRYKHENENI